jgi:hypothetical protein
LPSGRIFHHPSSHGFSFFPDFCYIVFMKPSPATPLSVLAGFLIVLSILALTACASKPKPDWNQRVGHYKFDDAVREMGPPFSSATLRDGGMAAEWFLKPGPQISFGLGTGFVGGHSAVGVSQGVAIPTPGHYLRLVFGPDGQLQHWEKVRH